MFHAEAQDMHLLSLGIRFTKRNAEEIYQPSWFFILEEKIFYFYLYIYFVFCLRVNKSLSAKVRQDWKVIARYKRSSLFGLAVSDEGKKFYSIV
jgi:hypothetical protein